MNSVDLTEGFGYRRGKTYNTYSTHCPLPNNNYLSYTSEYEGPVPERRINLPFDKPFDKPFKPFDKLGVGELRTC